MKTKHILATIIIILTTTSTFATSYTWTGASDSVYTKVTNWNPSTGYPGSADTAIIVSQANIPTLGGNQSVGRLVMTSGTLDLNGYDFTIQGTSVYSAGTIGSGNLIIRGTAAIFTGTTINALLDAYCDRIELSGGIFNESCIFTTTGLDDSPGTGGCVFNDVVTIVHNGTNRKAFQMGMTNGDEFNGNLTITNSSNGRLSLSENGITFFNENLTLNNNGTSIIEFAHSGGYSELANDKTLTIGTTDYAANELILYNFKQLGSTAQTITLTGTAKLYLDNCEFNGPVVITAPDLFCGNSIFNANCELIRTGTNTNYWYGNNIFNGTATIVNQGTGGSGDELRLAATLPNFYNSDAVFQSTGKPIQVVWEGGSEFKGSISKNNSNITFNKGVTSLTGSDAQSLEGSGYFDFYDLVIDKSAEHVTANIPLEIIGLLNLTSGNLVTDSINLLTMKAGSEVQHASNGSFVAGPVKKVGDTAFEFPVGHIDFISPLGITAPSNRTDAFTCEYINDGQHYGENTDSTIAFLNDCDHWKLLRSNGSSSVKVKLSWNINNCPIVDTTHLTVGSWSSNNWNDNGHGTIAGSLSSGSIESENTISDFEYLVLAYEINIIEEPLPDAYAINSGFTANVGQLIGTDSVQHPEILFYGLAGNTHLFLSDSIFSYSFNMSNDTNFIYSSTHQPSVDSVFRFDMRLYDIDSNYDIVSYDSSQGYENFYFGDSSYAHVLTSQYIEYQNIYEDITLSFLNNDVIRFNVEPLINPNQIKFYYQGVDSVKIDGSGRLNVYSRAGDKQYDIEAFTYDTGVWSQMDASFQKTDSLISFTFGSYSTSKQLMINVTSHTDPYELNPNSRLRYSTFVTNNNFSLGYSSLYDVVSDEFDNIYATGGGVITNFPSLPGIYELPIGGNDVYFIKLNQMREREFAGYFGGILQEFGLGIVLDNNNNFTITGNTSTPDNIAFSFPIAGTGTVQSAYGGGAKDGFISKFNSNGTLVFSTYYGGSGDETVSDIDINSNNTITIVGQTTGALPTMGGANPGYNQTNNGGLSDGFLVAFNSSNTRVKQTCLGGDDDDAITGVIYDANGNLFITGTTNSTATSELSGPVTSSSSSTDFPIVRSNISEYVEDEFGFADIFVSRLDGSNYYMTWSTLHGGSLSENIGSNSLSISELTDDLFLCGNTASSDFFTVPWASSNINNPNLANVNYNDMFLLRFDDDLSLDWSTYFGGDKQENTGKIATNDRGDVYFTFQTNSDDLSPINSSTGAFYDDELNGPSLNALWVDGYILKINSTGSQTYSTYLGGEESNDVVVKIIAKRLDNNQESIVIVGQTGSPNFPVRNIANPSANTFYQGIYQSSPNEAVPFITTLVNVSPFARLGAIPHETLEINNLGKFELYPNPSSGYLTLKNNNFKMQSIQVIDSHGKLIHEQRRIGNNLLNLNLSEYSNGIYFIKIILENGSQFNKKIILSQ